RASAIRADLAAALADWAGLPGQAKHAGRLREVARLGDPDPGRLRLRQAVARRDRAGLVALAGPRQLAALPALDLYVLGKALLDAGAVEAARGVLRAGQRRFPRDFRLNFLLGEALARYQPYRGAEAVRYLTVALSLRPRAPVVHLSLGTALARAGSADEAIAAYRQAIALKPDFALAHFNLGGR